MILKKFQQLSLFERELLYDWRKEEVSLIEISRRLGRDHTSLAEELIRNRVGKEKKVREYFNPPYMPPLAHEKTLKIYLKQR